MFRCALEVAAGINAQPHDRDCVHVDPVPVVGAARTAPASEDLLQIVRQLLHAFPVLPGAEKYCIAGSCTAEEEARVRTSGGATSAARTHTEDHPATRR